MHVITVIVPTTCEAGRTPLLERALCSVLAQDGVDLRVIVVANGPRIDPQIIARLRARDPRLSVIELEEGNVSKARFAGVCAAKGDYFCFLDDDDELLPGALRRRVDALTIDVDVVVTNGYERTDKDRPLVDPALANDINFDPCGTFLRSNWFASPAALFRSSSVPRETFRIDLRFFEWTWIFFRLVAARRRIRFVHELTYRKYEDNPLSVSRSTEYEMALPAFLRVLCDLDLNARTKNEIRRKYVISLNGQSLLRLRNGDRRGAWQAHLTCLFSGGWRYLPYTRRLIIGQVERSQKDRVNELFCNETEQRGSREREPRLSELTTNESRFGQVRSNRTAADRVLPSAVPPDTAERSVVGQGAH